LLFAKLVIAILSNSKSIFASLVGTYAACTSVFLISLDIQINFNVRFVA
jgi:hypothetical protein